MTTKIHQSAIISPQAKLGQNVEIGPFCIIGDDVEIGDNSVLKSHIVIEGNTKIGKNNIIFPFATIGVVPQDLKFSGEKARLIIGDNNKIREHVTIHLGTQDGIMETRVGSNCLLMVGAHIAHDCIVGNNVILANNATLAGHVEVADNVVIGGLAAIHQFVRIGNGAMIGGLSGVVSDILPYATVNGERAFVSGLNLIGLKRRGFERTEIHALRNFFKKLFNEDKEENFLSRARKIEKEFNSKLVKEVFNFIDSESSRSFCQTKNNL